jgi:hypothetical protein
VTALWKLRFPWRCLLRAPHLCGSIAGADHRRAAVVDRSGLVAHLNSAQYYSFQPANLMTNTAARSASFFLAVVGGKPVVRAPRHVRDGCLIKTSRSVRAE